MKGIYGLSLYRTEIMGVAMMSILVVHLLNWLSVTSPNISQAFALLGYTDVFFLLSRIGMYFHCCPVKT